MSRSTRTIKVDAEVFVSRCEICGSEELATAGGFTVCGPDGYPAPGVLSLDDKGARLVASQWHFKTHGEVRVSQAYHCPGDGQTEWRLCPECLAFVRSELARVIRSAKRP